VGEAELSLLRRIGASEDDILTVQTNLASTLYELGRHESSLSMYRDVHADCVRLLGEEHKSTIIASLGRVYPLISLQHFDQAKTFLRKTMPVAQRALGENDDITLSIRLKFAEALYKDATLADLREAVTTLEEIERTARRVFGGAHPTTVAIENELRDVRAALGSREMTAFGRGTTRSGDVRALREAVAAMSTTLGAK
jgi:hypothetical protein